MANRRIGHAKCYRGRHRCYRGRQISLRTRQCPSPRGNSPSGRGTNSCREATIVEPKGICLFGEAAMPAQQALFAEPPADLPGPKGQMRRGKPNLLSGGGKMPPWIAFLSGRSGKWVRQASSCLAASQTCHRARQRCMPGEQRSLLGWHLRQCYSQLQMRRSHRGRWPGMYFRRRLCTRPSPGCGRRQSDGRCTFPFCCRS